MDQADFWCLIDRVRIQARGDGEEATKFLLLQLRLIDKQGLIDFQRILGDLLSKSCRWDVWGAAFIIEGGCSDDSFFYFRTGLILRGEAAYKAAIHDVESLVDFAPFDGDDMLHVHAHDVYEELFDEKMPLEHYLDPKEPIGARWDYEELPKLFPRLTAEFRYE